MIVAYDATADWELPTGCAVQAPDGCPPGQQITLKSYPEALLFFLKQNGYVAKAWLPPEAFEAQSPSADGPAEESFDQTV